MMEPGQKVHEVFKREWGCEPGWGNLSARYKAAWAAVEAACVPAVPANVAGLVERLSSFLAGSNGARRTLNEAAYALQAQAAEIERLQDRLEMRKAFQLGEDGETLVEITVEPGSIPDGIAARDATIKLHDEYIDELEAKLREAVEVIQEARESIADLLSGCAKYGISPKGWLEDIDAFLATMEKQEDGQ